MTITTLPMDRNASLSPMRYDPRFQSHEAADDFDLMTGLRLIRRRAILIIALTILLMAAAFPLIRGLLPSYYAESRLMIHSPLSASLAAETSNRTGWLDVTEETERLLSRSTAERVIRDLRLAETPEFNPALRQASLIDRARKILRNSTNREPPPLPQTSELDGVVLQYYQALRVQRDGQTNVIRIGFSSRDPALAAAVPNYLISIYSDEREDRLRIRLDAAEEWVQQRRSEQQDRITAARDRFDRYRNTMGLALNDDAQGATAKLIADLSDRRSKLDQTRAKTRMAISHLESAGATALITADASVPESLAEMQRNLTAQQRDLDRVLEVYGDGAQAVIDLRARIARSRMDLDLATHQYLETLRITLNDLDREDAEIQTAIAAAQAQKSRNLEAQAEAVRLERLVEKEQLTMDKIEDQRRALADQARSPGAEIELLSPATTPLAPQGRGRLFYLIGALVASICFSVTIAFLVEMLDKAVRSFDQISGISHVVPIGFVPRLRRKERSQPLKRMRGGKFDDAIQTLIVSLKRSCGGKLPGSIVVTSAQKGEGKSTIARSLAMEISASGVGVILVDGNLKSGNLVSVFNSGQMHGLNEFVRRKTRLTDIVHHHAPTGIDFIPAGTPDLYRRAYFSDVSEIIEMARTKGQIVIFDSAPALESTDTMHLMSMVERTILVVQWARTTCRTVEIGVQHLQRSRGTDILIAINNVDPKRHAMYNFTDANLIVT